MAFSTYILDLEVSTVVGHPLEKLFCIQQRQTAQPSLKQKPQPHFEAKQRPKRKLRELLKNFQALSELLDLAAYEDGCARSPKRQTSA